MIKKCRVCFEEKPDSEFYQSRGYSRNECKKCRSKKNYVYQKKIKYWLTRKGDPEKRNSYSSMYYENNKDKWLEYRARYREKKASK